MIFFYINLKAERAPAMRVLSPFLLSIKFNFYRSILLVGRDEDYDTVPVVGVVDLCCATLGLS